MGRKRKYFTEEERIAAHREANRRYQRKYRKKHPDYDVEWRAAHPDYQSEWRQKNKEKIAAYQAEYWAEWYQKNKNEVLSHQAEYRQNNKEKIAEYQATYRSTPEGRARMLLDAYKQSDNLYNRGECTLTQDWIIEHIFSQPCHYCGETDWTKMGCDRIDNSLPHTPENVVPCCRHCNAKKCTTPYDEYLKKIGKIA